MDKSTAILGDVLGHYTFSYIDWLRGDVLIGICFPCSPNRLLSA